MAGEEFNEEDAIVQLSQFVVNSGEEQRIEVDIDGKRRTVDPRPIYSFERDLADDIIDSSLNSDIRGAAVPIKGRWIHGWLNQKGDDYINNTWHGYQYFLKYLESVTSDFENVSTYSRSPGTYDSMYRYLLVLEDLGLVERYRTEEVDADEYEFNVPEEFRTRTFLRITASYEGNENLWNNPIGIVYGPGDPDEASTTESDEDTDDSVDDTDEPDDLPQTLDDVIPDDTDIDSTESSGGSSEMDEFQGDIDESGDVGSEGDTGIQSQEKAGITDFNQFEDIPSAVNARFPDAVEQAFDRSPVPIDEPRPVDIEMGRVAVTGPWAASNATPGVTRLSLYIEIVNTSSSLNPGFLPGSIDEILSEMLTSDNPFPDTFPGYKIKSSYSSQYRAQLRRHVTRNESNNFLYSFDKEETEEL
ncbi:MAG: hypothetical protein J07AB43_02880 [Candidatus Nanosalina sp. J07AB43]|jgi:hypothetical protein|nr:MAG: hypothetical protein J07AB43_02880 [Candidatus Nanosalina sp. J07AB43]